MGFGIVPSQFHPAELDHQAVADITIVMRLIGLCRRHDAQFHQLRVCNIVEAEQVGAGFLQGGLIFAQGRCGHTRQQLAGTVSQALMQVGMHLVGILAVFLVGVDFLLRPGEFREGAVGRFHRGERIGMGDIGNGNALGTVLLADPVRIGQVDADRRRRIAGARHTHGVHHLGRHPLDGFLPEARIHGRMVLEPLGIGAQGLGPGRCRLVLDVDVAFPGCLAAQRVIIVLDKTVDKVHRSQGILHPFDIERIPKPQVAGLVIIDQQAQRLLLDVVFGHFAGQRQFAANLFDGRSVQAALLPGNLFHNPVRTLYHLGIQAIRNGLRVGGVGLGGIELLHLRPGNAFVEVHGRQGHDIPVPGGRAPLRQRLRIIDEIQQVGIGTAGFVHQRGEIGLRAGGHELILGIVMMDAVAEKDPFGIGLESRPIRCGTIHRGVRQNGFQHLPDGQVIAAILVPGNVPAIFGRLTQVIGIFFLLQAQFLPPRNPVADDFQVCKFFHQILEGIRSFLGCARCQNGSRKRNQHGLSRFHILILHIHTYKDRNNFCIFVS